MDEVSGPDVQFTGRIAWQDEVASAIDWSSFWEPMLEACAPCVGERVLDVGCGFAETTVEAARRVGPTGSSTGIDNSPEMLSRARGVIAGSGLSNVGLIEGDAQTYHLPDAHFDVVISAFGTMFFEDPVAAFANLRRSLRPGGRLAILCWQQMARARWAQLMIDAMAEIIGPPEPTPEAPGPHAFADGDKLTAVVAAGGFGDIELQEVICPERVGRDLADAVEFIVTLPMFRVPLSRATEAEVAEVVQSARRALTDHAGSGGVVVDAPAWLLTARC